MVGGPSRGSPDVRLVATAEAALQGGIVAAVSGGRVGDISAAISAVGRAGGCGINTDQGGHGVGRTMHEVPHVLNEGRAGRGVPARGVLSSSPGSWPAGTTTTARTPMAGRSAVPTAAEPTTSSTRSLSPKTDRAFSRRRGDFSRRLLQLTKCSQRCCPTAFSSSIVRTPQETVACVGITALGTCEHLFDLDQGVPVVALEDHNLALMDMLAEAGKLVQPRVIDGLEH